MRTFFLLCFCCLVLLPASLLAAEDVTYGSLKAAGVQPLPKDEVQALLAKGRLRAQTSENDETLWPKEDGTIRGEGCPRHLSCSKAAKGRGLGTWSLAEDGTLRLVMDWGRWGSFDDAGKLYFFEGYLYQFDGASDSKSWGYRFEK